MNLGCEGRQGGVEVGERLIELTFRVILIKETLLSFIKERSKERPLNVEHKDSS